jgi:hypothetical protein
MLKQLLKILNGMLLEAELVMSASMFSILSKMKHPIAKLILDIHQDKVDIGDNTYIDINHDKLGDITMLSHRRLERIPHDEIYTSRSRVPSGVGKLVRALLLKYGYTDVKNILKKEGSEDISGRDIELFVSEFKALQQAGTEEESNFKIVSGEEIRHWYLEDNYMDDNGTLGTSCMRYHETQDYLDMYCKEPNVSMLIYTEIDDEDGEEKLLGRALIWKETRIKYTDKEDEIITFMDRIYYNETHLEEVFKKYAQEQNWWYKVQQSYQNRTGITNGTDTMDAKMYVKLNHNYFDEETPYVDTFAVIEHSTGNIYNHSVSTKSKSMTGTEGNLDYSHCDACDGDGQYDCDSCSGGTIACTNCENGKNTCDICDGDYKDISCKRCNQTGVCKSCNGTEEVICRVCKGTDSNMSNINRVISSIQKMLGHMYMDNREVHKILIDLYKALSMSDTPMFKHISLEILEPHNITEEDLITYGVDGKCKECVDGNVKCFCKNGICSTCNGNKKYDCTHCEEGIDSCNYCYGDETINCTDCHGRGWRYCSYC